MLFDLAARKFYIFGLVFWPQDVIYLTVLLILSALSLFLFTAVAGRLWCGYACPQTVYTEIFLWIERKIEGDRLARIRLDAAPLSLEKFVKKALKHTAWIALAIWTGYTFVGYFEPIRDLGVRTITWDLGGWESFWIVFYGFATYGNAGWMREQVCKYMCPYARFQSVMFDHDTLVIGYDRQRGEPRGRAQQEDRSQGGGLGRLHQLRHLRAGLPDRHRHPRGPAIRMHRLRRLHRRLRPGDGQDGLSARPHPLRVAERARAPAVRRRDVAARVPAAHAALHGDTARGGDRRGRVALSQESAQDGHHPRPRRAGAREFARASSRTSTGSRS